MSFFFLCTLIFLHTLKIQFRPFKGRGPFFVGSVPGTDHSYIYAFLINNDFQAEKCIYIPVPAQSFFASINVSIQHSYGGNVFLVVIPKQMSMIHSRVFGKFRIHQYYVYHNTCPFFRFHMFIKEQIYLFLCQHSHVYTSTVYISCLFGRKPKKGIGILNGCNSRFAGHNAGNPHVYILYVYFLRIKLTRFCQRRHVYAGKSQIPFWVQNQINCAGVDVSTLASIP